MQKIYTNLSVRAVCLSFLLLFLVNGKGHSQTPISADPAVGSLDITTMANAPVNANNLTAGVVYKLKLQVFNLDFSNPIPPGTAYVRIGLGTKMVVDPAYDLSTAPLKDYFTFTPLLIGAQWELFCTLHTALPADFADEMVFQVKPTGPLGTSTITAQWLINNTNPSWVLSDLNPSNNAASLSYTVTSTLPVTITKFTAVNRDCRIQLNWSTAEEIDLARYEVEASNDGVNYVKLSEVPASGKTDYASSFVVPASMQQPKLLVRLKNIDIDGKFKYSKVVAVPGTCSGSSQAAVYAYPNPVAAADFITVATRQSQLDGAYRLMLTDHAGKMLQVKQTQFNNVLNFRYDLDATLPAGRYNLVIQSVNGAEKMVVPFQKL